MNIVRARLEVEIEVEASASFSLWSVKGGFCWLWITQGDDTVDASLAASSIVSLDMLAGHCAPPDPSNQSIFDYCHLTTMELAINLRVDIRLPFSCSDQLHPS